MKPVRAKLTQVVALGLAVAIIASGCAGAATTPLDRAVSVETTACGHASGTSGAGIIIEDSWVVSSAHVVAGAGSVEVSGSFGVSEAEIVVYDPAADLALLRVIGAVAQPVETVAARRGDSVTFAGGGPSEPFDTVILRPVEVRIEAVRSAERARRVGYEIDHRVELGDSGGGVFDPDNQLVGIVFGRSTEGESRSFIVGHEEIDRVLAEARTNRWSCDETAHRISPEPGSGFGDTEDDG